MSILEMFLALPDGSKKDYETNLNFDTKYYVSLCIRDANRGGRNKKEVARIVERAYTKWQSKVNPKPVVLVEPLFMPWECATEKRVLDIGTNPHEFGSQLDSLISKRNKG